MYGTRSKPGIKGPKPSELLGSVELEIAAMVRPQKFPSNQQEERERRGRNFIIGCLSFWLSQWTQLRKQDLGREDARLLAKMILALFLGTPFTV